MKLNIRAARRFEGIIAKAANGKVITLQKLQIVGEWWEKLVGEQCYFGSEEYEFKISGRHPTFTR